jgi:hypothetical protein
MSTVQTRFEGASWYKLMKSQTAYIGGVGATGSFFAFFLARTGVYNITLVDPDTFEAHNVGSQLVSYDSIGTLKVEAVRNFLTKYASVPYINTNATRFEESMSYSFKIANIIVSTTDSMTARKAMFEAFLTGYQKDAIFIDTRISAEYWEVFAITRNNQSAIDRYRETLFDDSQGNTGACNYQQSSHSAAGAAIQGVELITNHLNNILMDDDYLPFKCSKDLRTQNYNVIY